MVDVAVDAPVYVPEVGYGHAYVHHPAEGYGGVGGDFFDGVGDVGLGYGFPLVVEVGTGEEGA